jgi:hypothetical protein
MCCSVAVAGWTLLAAGGPKTSCLHGLFASGGAVPVYRIYFLDDAGRISSAMEADCDSDDAALSAAKYQLEAKALAEVWQLARCLGQVRGDQLSNS